jgi:transcriptional regulator with XRE-family HTH domain
MPADPLDNYLKMFRRRSGLTQHEVARLLGCRSGSKVGRYELSRRKPTFETMLGYEVVFRVTLAHLFAGDYRHFLTRARKRARAIKRELVGTEPMTPLTKRKIEFLNELIEPPHQ